jgi:hypothetical protein
MGALHGAQKKISLFIGYFLAQGALMTILAGKLIIWRDEPSCLDWPVAIASWVVVASFFHFLLFLGAFYCVHVEGEANECHAFLRKTKEHRFSDIHKVKQAGGLDVKIV